ncbi:MAG: hypothetical protein QNJ73_07260, partial [Gammaproteobacteria bacterium]|nr:hypothetical protein [Gammaproteobacteria bacterium]
MPRNASRFLFFAKPYFELTNESGLTLQGVPVPTFDDLMAPIRFSGILVAANRSVLLRWVWQRLRNLKWRFFYAESGYPWELTKALLEEFATVARENGHELIIMNIDESQPALEGPLTDITDALNVHLLNLGPVFREARDDEIAYAFAGDNHWTPVGHRVVAAELTRFLCQLRDETECNLAAPTTPNVQR